MIVKYRSCSDIAGESRENKPRIYLDEISRQQIQKLTKRVSPYCIYRFVFDFGTWSMCLNTPTDISLIKPINWPHCLLMTYRLRDKRGRSVYSRSTVEFELNLCFFSVCKEWVTLQGYFTGFRYFYHVERESAYLTTHRIYNNATAEVFNESFLKIDTFYI